MRLGLDDLTRNNLGTFKQLNRVILPVDYSPAFYRESLEVGELAKLAYYNDLCVGAVRCRFDKEEVPEGRLYIMTLGVLAAYRRLGLGGMLLDHVCTQAKEVGAREIRLHVSTGNPDAKEWYEKRGFRVEGVEEEYYKRIEPRSAFILVKSVDS